jgi:hypothetical protein
VKYGIELLAEQPGDGPPVERHQFYRIRLRMWLSRGDPVRWDGFADVPGAALEDDGATLVTRLRVDRGSLIPGLFYALDGMRVGGMRKVRIPPPFGFGERGLAGRVPPNAVLVAEVSVLATSSPA